MLPITECGLVHKANPRDEAQHITIIADDSGAACARIDAAIFRMWYQPGVSDAR